MTMRIVLSEYDRIEAQAIAEAAGRRAERVEVARRYAESALAAAKDAAASLSAFRMAVMGAQARVERAADMARLYVRELADLEASPEADRAAAALAVDLGAPETQVRAILSLPETIRP